MCSLLPADLPEEGLSACDIVNNMCEKSKSPGCESRTLHQQPRIARWSLRALPGRTAIKGRVFQPALAPAAVTSDVVCFGHDTHHSADEMKPRIHRWRQARIGSQGHFTLSVKSIPQGRRTRRKAREGYPGEY